MVVDRIRNIGTTIAIRSMIVPLEIGLCPNKDEFVMDD